MTCGLWLLYGAIAWVFLWLFDSGIGGIWFRLRLWSSHICYYHGAKTAAGGFGKYYRCSACQDIKWLKQQAKLDRLEARRKRVTGT